MKEYKKVTTRKDAVDTLHEKYGGLVKQQTSDDPLEWKLRDKEGNVKHTATMVTGYLEVFDGDV